MCGINYLLYSELFDGDKEITVIVLVIYFDVTATVQVLNVYDRATFEYSCVPHEEPHLIPY